MASSNEVIKGRIAGHLSSVLGSLERLRPELARLGLNVPRGVVASRCATAEEHHHNATRELVMLANVLGIDL